MNIAQRFTLLVKGSINAVFDSIEDPERSLHQLVLDMEEELEAAKRAAARAMANEDRLKARIQLQAEDERQWQEAASIFIAKGDEAGAREALERVELADRQAGALKRQLEAQARDTKEIRESTLVMQNRVGEAKSRLQLLQAKIRQGEARRAVNAVMSNADGRNLFGEFSRLGERVEERAAAEGAYARLDDEMSGEDLRRRVAHQAVDDAVERRLAELRKTAEPQGQAR